MKYIRLTVPVRVIAGTVGSLFFIVVCTIILLAQIVTLGMLNGVQIVDNIACGPWKRMLKFLEK